MSFSLKKFETENEIEEKKKKRQEEWEKVRKPDDPEECPEEPVDNRCLYDKLEEQRLKKQEEIDEQYALKNQVKGLDEDESKFLEFVENRQEEISKERRKEEDEILAEMKESQVVRTVEMKTEEKRVKSASTTQSNKRSQSKLLAGAVKRKGSEDNSPAKKSKSEVEPCSSSAADTKDRSSESNSIPNVEGAQPSAESTQAPNSQVSTVIGILPSALPGLGQYSDSSDSESSSSDSDCDISLAGRHQIVMSMREIKEQIQQHTQG